MKLSKGLLLASAAFLSLLLTTITQAEKLKSIPVGPELNSQAPEITVINTQKQNQSLKDIYGEKGAVIVFFRSADWCPFCKRHLIELNEVADQVKAKGYNMVGISYDSPEVMQQFTRDKSIKFPLLSDIGAKTVNDYGILNQQYKKGHRFYGIPLPGVLVINAEGKITDKHFFKGYKTRVTASDLLTTLSK